MNLKNLKAEDHFILHSCSLNKNEALKSLKFISNNFNWDYYWKENVNNGIAGILHKHFKKIPQIRKALPEKILKKHEHYYLKVLTHNSRMFAELKDVMCLLHEKGYNKIILIKGAFILPEIYKDIGSRPMSDIDMVVENTDTAEKISDALKTELNYRSRVFRNKVEIE